MKLKTNQQEYSICPKCGKEIILPPAISRVDNKTEICSACGVVEALERYVKYQELRGIKVDASKHEEQVKGIREYYEYLQEGYKHRLDKVQ